MIARNPSPSITTMPHTANTTALLTVTEVATLLRCSKAHVSKLVNGRVHGVTRLAPIRLGRRVLVRKETLEKWLVALDNHESFR